MYNFDRLDFNPNEQEIKVESRTKAREFRHVPQLTTEQRVKQ